jgi:tetratricopeptide (TPR) repeat protein
VNLSGAGRRWARPSPSASRPSRHDSLLVNAADAEKVRQLTGKSKTFRLSSFSPEDVVSLVFPLLELQLAAGEKTAWSLGSSGVAEAGVLYAQGLGQTPYQQAQSKLEQYDQERSLYQAIKLFNEAVNLDPRYAAAHAALAEARIRLYRLTRNQEDLALAEESVKQALALDDTRPGAWMTLGMVFVQRGDTAQAEKAFSEAIARNPNGADTYRELGLAYQRGRLWDKAETAYRKAIQLQPKSWSIHTTGSTVGSVLPRPRRNSAERWSSSLRTPACGRTWAVSISPRSAGTRPSRR